MMEIRIESCAKAETLVEFAAQNGWHATVIYEADHADVTLTSCWGFAETAEWWEWGIAVRWYLTDGRWRLGAVGNHSVVGNAMNVDGVPFDFYLNSLTVLRRFIVEPADLVAWFEKVAPR